MWQLPDSQSQSPLQLTYSRFLSRRLGCGLFLFLIVTWLRIPELTVIVTSIRQSASGSVTSKPQTISSQEGQAPSNPNNDDNTNRNVNIIPSHKNAYAIPSARTTSIPLQQDPSQSTFHDYDRNQRPRLLSDPNSTMRLIQTVGGPHFLTPLSGCRMARWILPILAERPFRRDCYKEVELATTMAAATTTLSQHPRILTNQTIHLVQSNDTIYMTYDQIQDFVTDILPLIQVEVVLISGQAQYLTSPKQSTIDTIIENPWILQWFCQNLPKYGGINPYHSKFASFPFGIKQRAKDDPLMPTNGLAYQTAFHQSLQETTMENVNPTKETGFKNQTIFAGYVTVTSNWHYRSHVPTTDQFLPPLQYYQTMAQSYYVLSPNGDRPECYRHYEALGLGTAPITQLPSHDLFQHFVGSGLVYDLGIPWDLQQLKEQLEKEKPIVNRNLVLEEYWMEYVDWYVGRELNWWNRYHGQGMPAKVADILKDFWK